MEAVTAIEVEDPPEILFVDDEVTAVKYFQRAVGSFASVIVATSVDDGKKLLEAHADTLMVVISDQRMPGQRGNKLLSYVKENHPHMVRILTTAYAELDETVEAINQGQIHRYLHKPWDITTLRMELRQALSLAVMRKEHAQLRRDKLMTLQRQLTANRIGALHALCTTLMGTSGYRPVENYLSTAKLTSIAQQEVNWQRMDYADLIGFEAHRSGQFGFTVRQLLTNMQEKYRSSEANQGLEILAEILPDNAKFIPDQSCVNITDIAVLTDFLMASAEAEVSTQHATWVAFLLWLDMAGGALSVEHTGAEFVCRLTPRASAVPHRLAAWVEKFTEM